MTIIITALAVAIIAALAFKVRRQVGTNKFMREYQLHLAEENEQLRRHLGAVATVIERSAGGVGKRIREHQEIVAAITTQHPALFEDAPGLKHWLSANDQFFNELKTAVVGAKQPNPLHARLQAIYGGVSADEVEKMVAGANIVYTPKD